jgi:hypothetical protein
MISFRRFAGISFIALASLNFLMNSCPSAAPLAVACTCMIAMSLLAGIVVLRLPTTCELPG